VRVARFDVEPMTPRKEICGCSFKIPERIGKSVEWPCVMERVCVSEVMR
jgi:hypothetical protein